MATKKVMVPLWDGTPSADLIGQRNFEGTAEEITLAPQDIHANTKLLLNFNGANGSYDFVDSSPTPKKVFPHATPAGGDFPTISTAQSKFGGSSGLLGTSQKFLMVEASTDWDLGNSPFTMQWWEYRTAAASYAPVLVRDPITAVVSFLAGYYSSGNLQFYASSDNSTWGIASGKAMGTAILNAWTHYAVTRDVSHNFYTFQNGVQKDTWNPGSLSFGVTTRPLSIGQWGNSVSDTYVGYLDTVSIIKGTCLWTAGFTPPTTQYGYYPSTSPSPTTTPWTALGIGDVVDMSTIRIPELVNVGDAGSIQYQYASNGGALNGSWLTLTQLRAVSDITITDATSSFKIVPRYNSNNYQKATSQMFAIVDVVTEAAGSVFISTLID